MAADIIHLEDVFLDRRDASVNQDWDRLAFLAESAWQWRDHDSLDELEALVSLLRGHVEKDWGPTAQQA